MKKNRVKIAISLEPEVLESVDRLAQKLDLPRSRMIENLLLCALDDVELLDSFGLFDLVLKARAFREFFEYKLGRRPLFSSADKT